MLVKFKYPRNIDGKDYAKGEHEVSASLKRHWYFKALMTNLDVEILQDEREKVTVGFALQTMTEEQKAELAATVEPIGSDIESLAAELEEAPVKKTVDAGAELQPEKRRRTYTRRK